MFKNYYVSYLTWYVITVACMMSFYGTNHNEEWERLLAVGLTLVMLLAVPRKQTNEFMDGYNQAFVDLHKELRKNRAAKEVE